MRRCVSMQTTNNLVIQNLSLFLTLAIFWDMQQRTSSCNHYLYIEVPQQWTKGGRTEVLRFSAPEIEISLLCNSTLSATRCALKKIDKLARHVFSSFWRTFPHCCNMPLGNTFHIEELLLKDTKMLQTQNPKILSLTWHSFETLKKP